MTFPHGNTSFLAINIAPSSSFFFLPSLYLSHTWKLLFLCKELQCLGCYNTISHKKLDQVMRNPGIGSPSESKREELNRWHFLHLPTKSRLTLPFEGKKDPDMQSFAPHISWPWKSLSSAPGDRSRSVPATAVTGWAPHGLGSTLSHELPPAMCLPVIVLSMTS